MNKSGIEIRSMGCEVRADPAAEGLTFSGYAARYNSCSSDLGGFVEEIAPGAFAATVGRDDVRCLVNHSPDKVLGRTASGTLRLEDRPDGLFFIASAPDTGWARDLAASVKRGDVNQCSFAFRDATDKWGQAEDGMPLRTLTGLTLRDVSIVTYPAYQATDAGVRSAAEVLKDRETPAPPKASNIGNKRKLIEIHEKEIL